MVQRDTCSHYSGLRGRMSRNGMRTLTLVITAFLYGCRAGVPVPSSPSGRGTSPTAVDTVARAGRVYLDTEVDKPAVAIRAGTSPRYPADLMRQGIGGRVQIRFVVDTTGRAEPSTVHVFSSTHPDFSTAVLKVMPQLRFTPAVLAGQRVRMWAIQVFEFGVCVGRFCPPPPR
jgi:TonB family protein